MHNLEDIVAKVKHVGSVLEMFLSTDRYGLFSQIAIVHTPQGDELIGISQEVVRLQLVLTSHRNPHQVHRNRLF